MVLVQSLKFCLVIGLTFAVLQNLPVGDTALAKELVDGNASVSSHTHTHTHKSRKKCFSVILPRFLSTHCLSLSLSLSFTPCLGHKKGFSENLVSKRGKKIRWWGSIHRQADAPTSITGTRKEELLSLLLCPRRKLYPFSQLCRGDNLWGKHNVQHVNYWRHGQDIGHVFGNPAHLPSNLVTSITISQVRGSRCWVQDCGPLGWNTSGDDVRSTRERWLLINTTGKVSVWLVQSNSIFICDSWFEKNDFLCLQNGNGTDTKLLPFKLGPCFTALQVSCGSDWVLWKEVCKSVI